MSRNIEIIFRPLSGDWPEDGKEAYDFQQLQEAKRVLFEHHGIA